SIPSSANQEDHVSMGTISSRHARNIIENSRKVIAIEAICAMQALEYKGVNKASKKLQEKWRVINEIVPIFKKDRQFHKDINKVDSYLKEIRMFIDSEEINSCQI